MVVCLLNQTLWWTGKPSWVYHTLTSTTKFGFSFPCSLWIKVFHAVFDCFKRQKQRHQLQKPCVSCVIVGPLAWYWTRLYTGSSVNGSLKKKSKCIFEAHNFLRCQWASGRNSGRNEHRAFSIIQQLSSKLTEWSQGELIHCYSFSRFILSEVQFSHFFSLLVLQSVVVKQGSQCNKEQLKHKHAIRQHSLLTPLTSAQKKHTLCFDILPLCSTNPASCRWAFILHSTTRWGLQTGSATSLSRAELILIITQAMHCMKTT